MERFSRVWRKGIAGEVGQGLPAWLNGMSRHFTERERVIADKHLRYNIPFREATENAKTLVGKSLAGNYGGFFKRMR